MERLFLLACLLLGLAHLAHSRDFYVGGEQGWVVNPDESYKEWTKGKSFHPDDKLVFEYQRGKDSVLLVDKKDFYSCNTEYPIKKYSSGRTYILLDRPGPIFFISGKKDHCNQGQKLKIVVTAARPPTISPSPSPHSPSPSPHSPPPHSPSPAPSPSIAPSPHTNSAPSIVVAVSRISFGVFALLLGLAWA